VKNGRPGGTFSVLLTRSWADDLAPQARDRRSGFASTGYRVQGFVAEDTSKDFEGYQAITSLACQQVHLVNAASGKVLGCEDDE
jgi:hypothetical protein